MFDQILSLFFRYFKAKSTPPFFAECSYFHFAPVKRGSCRKRHFKNKENASKTAGRTITPVPDRNENDLPVFPLQPLFILYGITAKHDGPPILGQILKIYLICRVYGIIIF